MEAVRRQPRKADRDRVPEAPLLLSLAALLPVMAPQALAADHPVVPRVIWDHLARVHHQVEAVRLAQGNRMHLQVLGVLRQPECRRWQTHRTPLQANQAAEQVPAVGPARAVDQVRVAGQARVVDPARAVAHNQPARATLATTVDLVLWMAVTAASSVVVFQAPLEVAAVR